MEELRSLLQQMMNADLLQIVLSNTRDAQQATKVKVRPVLIKGEVLFQQTLYRGTQVFHENFTAEEMCRRIEEYLQELFKQGELKSLHGEATVLVSKKGKMTIKKKGMAGKQKSESREREKADGGVADSEKAAGTEKGDAKKRSNQIQIIRRPSLDHNRTKQYILMDGTPVDFLVGLGVQTPEGRVTKARYDKFRQINRYLEFIEDVLEDLPRDRTIRIIDFGCGKSYLTFAMYYYLHELQHRDIEVTGLDLKMDVIKHCNKLAEQLHYDCLHFEHGDIGTYDGADAVDMVVTLHACDTATDYALEKAVKWGASVIMAVPCCQHEINKQVKCDTLQPIFKYGLIKERMSALITDALRANLLEQQGYDTQILEFIDMEHTPKNLLIRAVKRGGMQPKRKKSDIGEVTEFLHLSPTLACLLEQEEA